MCISTLSRDYCNTELGRLCAHLILAHRFAATFAQQTQNNQRNEWRDFVSLSEPVRVLLRSLLTCFIIFRCTHTKWVVWGWWCERYSELAVNVYVWGMCYAKRQRYVFVYTRSCFVLMAPCSPAIACLERLSAVRGSKLIYDHKSSDFSLRLKRRRGAKNTAKQQPPCGFEYTSTAAPRTRLRNE